MKVSGIFSIKQNNRCNHSTAILDMDSHNNNNVATRRKLRIAVGTTNPCKIKAVELAFHRLLVSPTTGTNNTTSTNASTSTTSTITTNVFDSVDVRGYNVESNVSSQPYNDTETKCGAINRAKNAYNYCKNSSRRRSSSKFKHHPLQQSQQPSISSSTTKSCDNDDDNATNIRSNSTDDDDEEEELWVPDLAIGIEGGLQLKSEDSNSATTTTIQSTATTTTARTNNQNIMQQQPQQQLYCMAWIAIFGPRTERTNRLLLAHDHHSGDDRSMEHATTKQQQQQARIRQEEYTTNTAGKEILGLSKTAMFQLPPALCTLILEQEMELGHADDILFHRTNSKQSTGTIGHLTNSLVDRTMFYEHAIYLAITPWIHPQLYPHGHETTDE
jgi:non-canonical (house-cleaning) NTP pyrophosphatase